MNRIFPGGTALPGERHLRRSDRVLSVEHHSLCVRRRRMRQSVKTIDAHVAGEPLRLIVEGLPRPSGKTMAQKRDWMKRHVDDLRRALLFEPRGHRDMCGAMLTEPVSPG